MYQVKHNNTVMKQDESMEIVLPEYERLCLRHPNHAIKLVQVKTLLSNPQQQRWDTKNKGVKQHEQK